MLDERQRSSQDIAGKEKENFHMQKERNKRVKENVFVIVTFHHRVTFNGFTGWENCSLSFVWSNLYVDCKFDC